MKTYDATKRVSPQLKKAIENVIYFHKKYQNCYFWKNTGTATERRSCENLFSKNNPSFKIIIKDIEIEVLPYLRISCRNFYYMLNIYKTERVEGNLISADCIKSNITVLKNLIK